MLFTRTPLFDRLYEQINVMPVIDCHEHMAGPEERPPYREPVASLIRGYVFSDLMSAGFGVSERDWMRLQDEDVPTDEKWPLFRDLWRSTEHTAYARVTKLVLQNVYGEGEITRVALGRIADKLCAQDEAAYFRRIDDAGIQAILVDVLGQWAQPERMRDFLDGKQRFPDKWRPLIALPDLHPTNFSWETVYQVETLTDRTITSLDEFLETIFDLFQRLIERGCIGIKDQSAYSRIISYDLVPKSEAERQFNSVLNDPRNSLGWPDGKPLNDYLFHQVHALCARLGSACAASHWAYGRYPQSGGQNQRGISVHRA